MTAGKDLAAAAPLPADNRFGIETPAEVEASAQADGNTTLVRSATADGAVPPGVPPPAKVRPRREAGPKDFFRVFAYATKWDFVAYVVGIIAAIGAGATFPLMNIFFGQFAGNFVDINSTSYDDFMNNINTLGLYMLVLFIVRFILNSVNKLAFRMIGIRLSSAVRLHYLTALFGQSIHVLDSLPPGAAASTITATANVLQLGISEKLGTLVEFMSTIVTSIIVAFTWSWELTLVSCTIIVFLFLVIGIVTPHSIKLYQKYGRANSKAVAVASEALAAIRMVAASGAEKRISDRFDNHIKEGARHKRIMGPLLALQLGLVFFGLFAVFGLSFWYGNRAYSAGRIDGIAPVVICMTSVMMIVLSMERISTPLLAISKAMVAAAEFFTVIDAPKPETGVLKEPDVSASEDIVFKDVTFAYPGRPHVKILDGLDLTVKAGKITAIVGSSGSGKSTVVGLIERWYNLRDQYVIAKAIEKKTDSKETKKKKKKKSDHGSDEKDDVEDEDGEGEETGVPVELKGSIETCGRSLDEIDLKWWRSQIGLVQQEPFLFDDTIFKNVAYGLVGTQWEHESDEKKLELVKEACKEAFADEYIDRLPDKYHTRVGDSGAKLSGGQRQRLAIARSIVRKPKILILDEATSAIDVRGERIVQAALDKVSQSRTTITIAHRLSTIKKADRIVVMNKGRIVEQGTHESLLQIEGGAYHGLVYAQQLFLGDESDREKDDEDVTAEEDEGEAAIAAVLSREKSLVVSGSHADTEVTDPKKKERAQSRRLWNFLMEQKSQRPFYLLTIFFAAMVSSNVPLMAWIFAESIQAYQFTGDKLRTESSFWALMWVVLGVGVGLGYLFMITIAYSVARYVTTVFKVQYFDAIVYQKPSFFDHEDNSKDPLTARLKADPEALDDFLGLPITFTYQGFLALIGGLAISFAFSWRLAIVAFCVVVPLSLVSTYFVFRYEIEFSKINNAVFEESSKFASEAIGAARTVSSLTMEGPIVERYRKLLDGHVHQAFRMACWRSPVFGISDSMPIGCQALLLWYGGRLLLDGSLGVVPFFVAFMASTQGAQSAGQGFALGQNVALATSGTSRFLDARESRNRDGIAESEKIPDADGGMKIEIRDVHFKYPTRDIAVFKGLNLTIEKGQFAALVGPSGCGKTSIVSLLERFYEPQKGSIVCNGRDISTVNVHTWRKYLSLVAQEPTLLKGSIRDNVLLGVDSSSVTDEQMYQACRDASIHDFVVSLPEGYNTDIGSRGVSLSGGQKQRLSIARALIRDPKVLLLDEATSSLDSESEHLVQAAFERAAKGRTMVVVAHRLATIQNADVVFVMDDKKVLEQGTHAELLRKKGVYWHMCQNQALDR